MRRSGFLLVMAAVAFISAVPVASSESNAVTCGGYEVTVFGTEGDDVLVGTDGSDVIHGLGGNDRIDGGAGDDYLCGGSGSDTLLGKEGRDLLVGGRGHDLLYGGDDPDVLAGNSGSDALWGAGGADRLNGGSGNDRMVGGRAADTLVGGSGSDRLSGQHGGDSLAGGPGGDVLAGGTGNDRCDGGAGSDRATTCEDIDATESGQLPTVRLQPSRNAVALTFDDGPSPLYTPRILDILDDFGVKATFFVLGVEAEAYPGLIRDIAARGHSIQNHTYRHYRLPSWHVSVMRDEIDHGADIIEELTGVRSSCFRPPFGATNATVFSVAAELGQPVLLWDVDTQDYATPGSFHITNRALQAEGGDVILMHDAGGDRWGTVRALPQIIEGLAQRGLRFETLCD